MSSDHQMKSSAQRKIKALPGNTSCCDCGALAPDWASLSYGTLFCLNCSGVHRSLGTHISFVRSVDMDSWTKEQIKIMKLGGNDKCNQFLKKYNIDPQTPIKEKYTTQAAHLYRDVMKARLDGLPEPTELPAPIPIVKKSYSSDQLTSCGSSISSENSDSSDSNDSGRKTTRKPPLWMTNLSERVTTAWNNRIAARGR